MLQCFEYKINDNIKKLYYDKIYGSCKPIAILLYHGKIHQKFTFYIYKYCMKPDEIDTDKHDLNFCYTITSQISSVLWVIIATLKHCIYCLILSVGILM